MLEELHALLMSKLLPIAERALLSLFLGLLRESSFKKLHYPCRIDNITYYIF